jgi:hypothetical protein
VQTLWKALWRVLKKLEIELPYDPMEPLLGMYAKEDKTGYSRNTCTLMFIPALFTILKLWKQPRCPTTDKRNKKLWHIYKMEYYLANDVRYKGKWRQFEDIMLSEVSLDQKHKSCMFSLICGR